MNSKAWLILMAITMGASLIPSEAEARFGKRSTPSEKKKPRKSSSSTGRSVHAASAPGAGHSASSASYASTRRARGRPSSGYVYASSHVYTSDAPVSYRRRTTVVSRSPWNGRVFLGTQAQVFEEGASLGVQVLLEGKRWGFNVGVDGVAVARDDSFYGYDTLQMLDLHLTYAFFSTKQARLRFHVGADSVFAEDLVVMGPSIGLSLDANLLGPFGIHASSQVTPFPYQQLDSQVGGSLNLGALAIRGGLRATWLDDAGLVDGVSHEDTLVGPYLGLALVF